MALALMICTPNNASGLSGDFAGLTGALDFLATEDNIELAVSETMTFSKLRARVRAGNSGTATFQFRDTNANGVQNCTVAGAGTAEDATNTDTLTAGDLCAVAYTDTASSSDMAWIGCNVEFASGYGAIMGAVSPGGTVLDVASSTRFHHFAGQVIVDFLSNNNTASHKFRGFTSIEALQVFVSANARTNTSTFANRKNGSAGAGSIAVTAGATGLFQDTTIGDSIADGDLINGQVTLGTGVEDLTITLFAATFKSSDTEQDVFLSTNGVARTASATAHYFPLGGCLNSLTALTEANARCKPGFAGTAKNLRCYLGANTYTVDATLKLYQNGVAVITTTLTAGGGAAWYENTADSITFDADDELSYEIVGGTSGSASIIHIGITLAPSAAAAVFTKIVGPQFRLAGQGGLAA
ncbi:MAG: hypothetical protein ACREEP_14135 [Dongiaceae bacterium]